MNSQKHTAEFESCIEQATKQGHDKESAFAICADSFKKADKPIHVGESETQKLHLFCESFELQGKKVSGVAIHPKRIFHPEEGITHVYLREELEKAAPTLVGKPFGIDHAYVLPLPNVITKAWYSPEHEGVCFEGLVDDHIATQINRKAFKGISIELNWLKLGGSVEYVNGVAARNFEFTGVHFLKQFPPGDPEAHVKLWEQIREQLVVGPPLPLDQRVETAEQQIQEVLNQINVINAKLEVLTGSAQPTATISQVPPSPLRMQKQQDKDEQDSKEYKEFMAQCTEKGKTVEQCTAEWKQKQGEDEERQGSEEAKTDSLVALRKKLVDIEARLTKIEKEKNQETASWKRKHEKLQESVKGAIPPSRIWKSWTPGPQRYVQENLRILRQTESQSQKVHPYGSKPG